MFAHRKNIGTDPAYAEEGWGWRTGDEVVDRYNSTAATATLPDASSSSNSSSSTAEQHLVSGTAVQLQDAARANATSTPATVAVSVSTTNGDGSNHREIGGGAEYRVRTLCGTGFGGITDTPMPW
jgi:hypothetical protein